MLTIEMKVNGTIIGQMYAHNKGYVDVTPVDPDGDWCEYDWHCYLLNYGDATLTQGTLLHKRTEGFGKLAALLFAAADK